MGFDISFHASQSRREASRKAFRIKWTMPVRAMVCVHTFVTTSVATRFRVTRADFAVTGLVGGACEDGGMTEETP